ncbi:Fur family transcriptional regulator [Corynebacterium urealyticum]|uniref:Fur family transcriptional regulator n=1 Tax=Corynebacterium urealyticum TaxID=43771 RepID=UPI00293E76B4|nr:Fur family transcriptional regulator [Corynebacterium urealyticum]WOH93829.1 Fur family transcriptional regulator [Corynebacterium urealyticum]
MAIRCFSAPPPPAAPNHGLAIDNLLKISAGRARLQFMVSKNSTGGISIGQRNTRQRAAVVAMLEQVEEFASAQDIHARLVTAGEKVGLTTVYRTLQQMSAMGAIDTLNNESGETLYRRCAMDTHHHHLVCNDCRTTVEIDGGPVEDWARDVAKKYGFQKTGHTADVFGLCADCAAKKTQKN